ncbi:MAG: group 1 truncated hemoglobin [Nitrospina sp.]|jgi:hemoglobin|nr:group 1 truncated hemoglobin [Nitrospina sp.]MBT3413692.1 group 1 truncated hemoglobin [Nitrospina sp.]MBT3857553.1 group 1 truncated hemoglobin [Nitrospina sp.]MBT4104438.1 group 1 truncated hemoglobin [Nitrospina sp.]MBT4388717.1 group 1 truncated hemoglobin [Nitrospina sp.]
MDETEKSLFELVGGRPTLEKVHKIFYDKLYVHPWLKHFFAGIDQKHIENQQTDFMVSNMGGAKLYTGGLPKPVHKHMNIPEELFDIRGKILRECILECGVTIELAERWIRIDNAFKKAITKKNISDCEKRFNTDSILDFPKPSQL